MKYLIRLTKGMWKNKLAVAVGFLTVFIDVIFTLFIPKLMTIIVDKALPSGDMILLRNTALLMVLVALGAFLASAINNYVANWISQEVSANLRVELFEKIQSLSLSEVDELKTGRLVTNCTNDITQLRVFISMIFRMLARAPFMLIGGIIMSIYTSRELAAIYIVLIPALAIVIYFIMKNIAPLFGKMQKEVDGINSIVQENVAAPKVVKSFVNFKFEENRFNEKNDGYRIVASKANRIIATLFPAITIIINIGFAGIMFLSAVYIENGVLVTVVEGAEVANAGVIIAFFTYTMYIMFSLIMAAMMMVFMSRAEASSKRISEVLDVEVKMTESSNPVKKSIKGNIKFESVDFSYKEDGNNVLNNISFEIKSGEKVGVIGSTGSGKSTLINLIPRLYDVKNGSVKVDDIDVRDYETDSLRKEIGLVTQKAQIFSGDFKTNILQGYELASEEEIIEATEIALAKDFIDEKVDGYDEVLFQDGSNLSGGQKQRLSLSRAVVRKPKILILDDSTSALDANSEKKVMEGINSSFGDSTLIIISQKISSIIDSDKIIVLDNYGNLDGFGTHKELLNDSKVYKEIYESQYGVGGVYNE
ncbi:ABC transporter ATP-binding protein [Mycoplasmatota bacterium WC44]